MSTITWCLPSGLGVSMSGMFVCRCPPLPSLLLLRSYYAPCHHRTNSPVGRYRTHGQHPRSHRPTPARPLVWYHKHFYFWCFHLTLLVNIYQSMCFVCEMWDWIWLKNSKKCAIFNVRYVDWSNSLWNNGMKYGQCPKSKSLQASVLEITLAYMKPLIILSISLLFWGVWLPCQSLHLCLSKSIHQGKVNFCSLHFCRTFKVNNKNKILFKFELEASLR